jgi:hypothetical protein
VFKISEIVSDFALRVYQEGCILQGFHKVGKNGKDLLR